MKLKHIFTALLGLALVTACSDDNTIGTLDGISLDKSYATIPQDGGNTTVTVTANGNWQLDKVFQIITRNGDVRDTTYQGTPAWLTASVESGSAGQTTITFSAPSTESGREAQLQLSCNGKTQFLQVRQGSMEATQATCADVIAGAEGKTFRVKGTVQDIYSTTYGNWYLEDETGRITIYGTLDAEGKTQNFSSLDIENGDSITVEGPKQTYNGTVELVNVTVIKHVKSLIKLVSVQEEPVSKDGGDFKVTVAYKGSGANPTIPENAKSWLGVSNIERRAGVPTKTVKNPADTAIITFHAQPNTAGARKTEVVISSNTSSIKATVSQQGSIIDATLAEFRAASVGTQQYRVEGLVTRIDSRGNYYINDYTDPTGTVEIYGPTGDLAKSVKVGDIVTVVGTRAEYRGTIETSNSVVEKVVAAKSVSLAEFNAAPDGNDLLIITGTIKSIAKEQYGNIYITDGTTDVYVYGMFGYGAPKGADQQNFLTKNNIKEGDQITLVGVKSSYNGSPQMKNGYYLTHKSASAAKRK